MIEVVEAGPLASVQDPFGRPGWRRYGVAVGGAADAWSARLANLLAGNHEGAALLEATLGGAVFRVSSSGVVAVAGGLAANVDGRRLDAGSATTVRDGAIVRLEPADGARGYLAVSGGIAVDPVMGSASTDLRSVFGGHQGRALRAGDRLAVGPQRGGTPGVWSGRRADGPVRVVAGPHPGALEALCAAEWTVSTAVDRAGARLDGPALSGGEVDSMGLPLGAIQVPPDGRPIVMLADRPVTGGYLVPACVIGADIGRVAQMRIGDVLRLVAVTVEEARQAWEESEAQLAAITPLDGWDVEAGWAGSHR